MVKVPLSPVHISPTICRIELQEIKGKQYMKLTNTYQSETLSKIEALYQTAFPPSEKKPFSLMLGKREQGWMEILAIESDQDDFLGLAITMICQDIVLLDYFAIADEMRGSGIGSQTLQLLKNRYKNKRLLLEIESTATESPDHEVRLRRKNFYTRNGLCAMPYMVELFGVEMEIMTFPGPVSFEEYHAIFETIFDGKFDEKVILL